MILRHVDKAFTAISNTALQDSALSLECRGLLAFMLSLPSDWKFTIRGLATQAGCSVSAIQRCVKALERAGYIVRGKERSAAGEFQDWCWTVSDEPLDRQGENTDVGVLPTSAETDNRVSRQSDFTDVGKTACIQNNNVFTKQPILQSNKGTKKATAPRHEYGAYSNALLTDDDMNTLKAEFPGDWQDRIERLSEYIASSGRTYKNHLATIRVWARRDKPAQTNRANAYSEEGYI